MGSAQQGQGEPVLLEAAGVVLGVRGAGKCTQRQAQVYTLNLKPVLRRTPAKSRRSFATEAPEPLYQFAHRPKDGSAAVTRR